MQTVHVGQVEVPYEVRWSGNRETVGLSIDESMTLTVSAPRDVPIEEVESVLDQKKEWLLNKVNMLREQVEPPLDKEFMSGEKLLYNGRRYRLRVQENDGIEPQLQFDKGEFDLHLPLCQNGAKRQEIARQTVVEWYNSKAEKRLPDRVVRYAERMDVKPETVNIRDLTNQWGRYRNSAIELHWRLVLAPTRIQDYVIVHELAHANENTHSRSFWNKVGTVLPDYEERMEWLRLNGNTLQI